MFVSHLDAAAQFIDLPGIRPFTADLSQHDLGIGDLGNLKQCSAQLNQREPSRPRITRCPPKRFKRGGHIAAAT